MVKKLFIFALIISLSFACAKKKKVEMPEKKVVKEKKVEKVVAPPPPTPPITKERKVVKKAVEKVERFIPEPIYFEFDRARLLPEAKEKLEKLAEWMRKNRNVVVRIEGNCDERGTEEYNLALGQRRADSAKNYLISLGISPSRIITISYGEEKPVCYEHNESCWWRNRRCDFKILER